MWHNETRTEIDLTEENPIIENDDNDNSFDEPNLPQSSEIELLKEENDKLINKYQLALADYQNLKRRTDNQINSIRTYQDEHLLRSLIPVIKTVYQSKLNAPGNDSGPELIWKSLVDNLHSNDIELIIPEQGDEFNDEMMYAISSIPPQKISTPENTVCQVLSPAVKYKDKMIEYAQVLVYKF